MSPLNSNRRYLVEKIFLHSADDDYICARLCACQNLHRHFVWNAAQALEKYIKGVLLLCDQEIKRRHSFADIFEEHILKKWPELFSEMLDINQQNSIERRFPEHCVEATLAFVRRLEALGAPAVRYRETNVKVLPYDLQKLDLITFQIRRLFLVLLFDANERETRFDCMAKDTLYSPFDVWPTATSEFESTAAKRKALKFQNSIHFPEQTSPSRDWYVFAMDMAPETIVDLTDINSQHDLDWFRSKTGKD
ncbi:MAG: HEPN domain-containing protein [Tateyamaria sp.]|uniref:HEPN domain-containing protein n=1 Tax=Tateyamaria sp. TaxID=1929288 RepID=UPI00329ACE28